MALLISGGSMAVNRHKRPRMSHSWSDLAAITRAAHLSNEDHAVNDIHDILKAYYKVALKRYMDNVVLQ